MDIAVINGSFYTPIDVITVQEAGKGVQSEAALAMTQQRELVQVIALIKAEFGLPYRQYVAFGKLNEFATTLPGLATDLHRKFEALREKISTGAAPGNLVSEFSERLVLSRKRLMMAKIS